VLKLSNVELVHGNALGLIYEPNPATGRNKVTGLRVQLSKRVCD